jgi:hypothetical protein
MPFFTLQGIGKNTDKNMLSLVSSFEYSATQKAPSFRVELVMLLFCLAGILLFVGGIVVGKQLNISSWPQDESDKTMKTKVTHGKFGAPRYPTVQVNDSVGTDQLRLARN